MKKSGNFRRGAAYFFFGAYLVGSALGLSGCATIPNSYKNAQVDQVLWEFLSSEGGPCPNCHAYIIEKGNDLYIRNTLEDAFSYKFQDKQITHTPSVKESNVGVYGHEGITMIKYFAHEEGGGHWYKQPLDGDDNIKVRADN